MQDVPDWFVTQQQIKILQHDWYNNNLIGWHEGYEKRKAQKAQIEKELMPIAWHPSRWWDWCIPNNEKQETEIFFWQLDMLRLKNVLTKEDVEIWSKRGYN